MIHISGLGGMSHSPTVKWTAMLRQCHQGRQKGKHSPSPPSCALMGIIVGSVLCAAAYPRLKKSILDVGYFGRIRLPELLKVNDWVVVVPVAIAIVALLWWLETAGL